MNKEADYASNSDESDEDFCPEKEAAAADSVSEEETDAESLESDIEEKATPKKQKNLLRKERKKVTKKKKANTENTEEKEAKRLTRGTDNTGKLLNNATTTTINFEKDELDSDEEDKSRTESLWADFMGDVKSTSAIKTTTTTTIAKNTSKPTEIEDKVPAVKKDKSIEQEMKKGVFTEVLEFAGEEVKVQKTVKTTDNIKENESITKPKPKISFGIKRSFTSSLSGSGGGGGGLGVALDTLGQKKKKLSVLEKSKLDWNSFKHDEGIDEDIQTHNKGKDGFLERQDFLQRTDLRQFEIEKQLRLSKRK